jgi:DNA-binding CsgD family transcriptional regulator
VNALCDPPVRLRRSQRELLELMIAGNRLTEIAQMWGVRVQSVHDSVVRIRRKLGARTSYDMIVIAVRDRHVTLPVRRPARSIRA